jgi:hypothetical protein
MTLYLETPEGFVPWNPANPIDGVRYPPNLEDVWDAVDLAAIGLYTPEETLVPDGKQLVSYAVDRVDGVVRFVHTLEDIPPLTVVDFPLTARQIRLGLVRNGVPLSAVQTAIDSLPSPQKDEAQIYWEFSTEVHWEHAMTQALIALVGLTTDEASAMWMVAKDYER